MASVAICVSVFTALQFAPIVATTTWTRSCNMYCDAVSSYRGHPGYDTVDEARFDCANRLDCVGIVDHTHTANKGRVGLCGKNSQFLKGTDHHAIFANVCVERKSASFGEAEPSMLLQEQDGERTTTRGWEQKVDVICDGADDWESTLEAAKAKCTLNKDCVGVMDHSSTAGKFAICTRSMPLKQASLIHAGWKDLSVHLKH